MAVSCASPQFCEALDNRGNVFSYRASKWGPIHSVDANMHAVSISCPTAKFCMLIDGLGYDVTWDGHSWSRPASFDLRGAPSALSCPTADMCFVADARGDVTPYSTGHWGAPMSVDKAPVAALSCLSAGRCVAGDRIGDILSSQSGKWTAPSTTGNGGARITAISCTRGSSAPPLTRQATHWSALDILVTPARRCSSLPAQAHKPISQRVPTRGGQEALVQAQWSFRGSRGA